MLKETLLAFLILAYIQDAHGNDINDDFSLETSNEEQAKTDISKNIDDRIDSTIELENSLVARLESLEQHNTMLTQKIERMERQVQTDVTSSDKREIQMMQQLMKRIEDIEDAIVPTDDVITREKIPAGSRQTAFSVAATRHQVGQNSGVTPILLDHVFLNLGGDFNVANSTFICQVPGYYFFTYTMRSYDGHYLGVNLVKNHEPIVASFSDQQERSVMDSQSIMLELVAGDLIYLVLGASDRFAYHSDRHLYSTFSGFLRYKKNVID